jgi:hypothetical protein
MRGERRIVVRRGVAGRPVAARPGEDPGVRRPLVEVKPRAPQPDDPRPVAQRLVPPYGPAA